jgi:hypothetical protein
MEQLRSRLKIIFDPRYKYSSIPILSEFIDLDMLTLVTLLREGRDNGAIIDVKYRSRASDVVYFIRELYICMVDSKRQYLDINTLVYVAMKLILEAVLELKQYYDYSIIIWGDDGVLWKYLDALEIHASNVKQFNLKKRLDPERLNCRNVQRGSSVPDYLVSKSFNYLNLKKRSDDHVYPYCSRDPFDTLKARLRFIFDPKYKFSNMTVLKPLLSKSMHKEMLRCIDTIRESNINNTRIQITKGVLRVLGITLCVVDDDTGCYLDMNSIMWTALHEMAHATLLGYYTSALDQSGHTLKFHEVFKALRIHAANMGFFDRTKYIVISQCTNYKGSIFSY